MTQTIVVFVPGITGTQLLDPTNPTTPAWPNQVFDLVNNNQQDQIVPLLERSDLYAGDPLRAFDFDPIYEYLINYFTLTLGDYTYVTQNESLPVTTGNVLVGYGYDWRQPNEKSAYGLALLLTFVAKQYPGANIWILAHSMGGLVSRYVIESGEFGTPAYTLTGLITMATPHLGVPLALSGITGEINPDGLLGASIIEQLVDFPSFTSTFEMLPLPQTGFITDQSGTTSYSVYAPEIETLLTTAPPDGFGAPQSSLDAAQAFSARLNYSSTRNFRPPYYIMYGTDVPTIYTFVYNPNGGSPADDLAQQPASSTDSGDGTVPQWSASFENGYVSASYAAAKDTHLGIVNDEKVLKQIASWIANASASAQPHSIPPGAAARPSSNA